jgi:hypothetical protein
VLPRCGAASIALVVDGTPTTVSASEHVALGLDIVQCSCGEGSCLSGARRPSHSRRSRRRRRSLHHFATGAIEPGVHSVLSTPIIDNDDVIGTLNLYSREARAFDDTADHIADRRRDSPRPSLARGRGNCRTTA